MTLVGGGEVDRAEWVKFVNELLDEIPRRKKAPLARKLDVSDKTIDRWLDMLVDVSEASVRQVAARSGRNPMELLIRVGYYRRSDMPAPEIPPEDQWIIDVIQGSTVLSREKKARLIAIQLEEVRREREERKRRIEQNIDMLTE